MLYFVIVDWHLRGLILIIYVEKINLILLDLKKKSIYFFLKFYYLNIKFIS